MKIAARFVIAILCIIALYYLVVVLARGVATETSGISLPAGDTLAQREARSANG